MASLQPKEIRPGVWKYDVVYDEPTPEGKRKQRRKRFDKRRDAKAFLRQVEQQITEGNYVAPSRLTLHQLFERFLAAADLKPNTLYCYGDVYQRHFKDTLGSVPAQQITTDRIQALLNQLSDSGLSRNTVLTAKTALSSCYRRALNWKLVTHNPVQGTTVQGSKASLAVQKEKHWTMELMRSFLSETAEHRHNFMWRLMATYGFRPGEVVALRWDDFDLERGTMLIDETQTRDRDGKRSYGAPKSTSSLRTLILAPEVVAALRQHKQQHYERFLRLGRREGIDYLFPSNHRRDTPISTNNANIAFRKEVLRLGLPVISLHGLRHTAATEMVKAKVPARVVQETLGHSSINTTLGIYFHVDEGMKREAAKVMSGLWAEG